MRRHSRIRKLGVHPDLVVLAIGNNEFVELKLFKAPGCLLDLFRHSTLFCRLERNLVHPVDLSSLFPRLPVVEPGPDARIRSVLQNYRTNLAGTIRGLRASGIPVAIATIPHNLRAAPCQRCPDAIQGGPEDPIERFKEASRLELEGRLTEARDAYQEAEQLDCDPVKANETSNKVVHQVARELQTPVWTLPEDVGEAEGCQTFPYPDFSGSVHLASERE